MSVIRHVDVDVSVTSVTRVNCSSSTALLMETL